MRHGPTAWAMKVQILLAILLVGCGTSPQQSVSKAQIQDSAAVRLLKIAREESSAGRLGSASQFLERALHIEPSNARLWAELASVRLREGRYKDAETHATRANSLARADFALRAENWRIIAEARHARGDLDGAASATELAKRIGASADGSP